MSDLTIAEPLAERLTAIAEREHRSVEAVLLSMLEQYTGQNRNDAFLTLGGMFDDDIEDLSSVTRDDIMKLYQKKYADSD